MATHLEKEAVVQRQQHNHYEISSQANEYFSKQLKIKYGVWSKQNGKWMYATNPSEWTSKIIQSWNKKKK
jgi:hypothetical protein